MPDSMTAVNEVQEVLDADRSPCEWDVWSDVAAITRWLDVRNGNGPHEVTLRILKIGEEFGEVAAAHIGMTGQNPRKGISATCGDLAGELADVILAALVALNTVTGDQIVARAYLASRTAGVLKRTELKPPRTAPPPRHTPGT